MAELKIGRITLGMCQTNFYFLYMEGSNEVLAVDPADKGAYLFDTLKKHNFTVGAIFLTHGHFDHMLAAESLRKEYHIPVCVLREDAELLKSVEDQVAECVQFGLNGAPMKVEDMESNLFVD